jgi:hypothetical protein
MIEKMTTWRRFIDAPGEGRLNGIVWRVVELQDDPWLLRLVRDGMAWQGAKPDQPIIVVASISDGEWAVYYMGPDVPPDVGAIRDYGIKVPEEVGRRLFPFDQLEWRP